MPRVLLIGDSIRMGYQPVVASLLAGRVDVIGPEDNGGDSRRILANLAAWLGTPPPDVVHINCGLHDLKTMLQQANEHQVPLDEYRRNIPQILVDLRRLAPKARIIWATTTPVVDERFVNRKEFIRRQADVVAYNAAALAAAQAAGVEVNDLHAVVEAAGRPAAVSADGTHMSDLGNQAIAQAVANCIIERTS
ncbi:MAG: SGNH/GDSL hydrolase family protein [Phycisphaerae bacterium]|nr:SGNH/GDSL hydrolase family protein [Phycisphaerae bacterium]